MSTSPSFKAHEIKTVLLLLSGCLPWIMSGIIPMEGGGAAIVLVLTVPIGIGASLLLMVLYHRLYKRKSQELNKAYFLFHTILVAFAMYTFPWA